MKTTMNISGCRDDPDNEDKLKPIFETLKTKIDMAKVDHRYIKNILPQQNKTELMIHEFELVRDNFRQFYATQQKIKQKIEKIEDMKGNKVNEEVHYAFMSMVKDLVDKSKTH